MSALSRRDRFALRAAQKAEQYVDKEIAEGSIDPSERASYIESVLADDLCEYDAQCAEELEYRRDMGEMDDSPCLQPEDFMSFHS
jgi:hypothetical protein